MNNYNSIPTTEAIVAQMNSFLPRSKKNNRGSSYEHIANQYVLKTVNTLCKGNLLDDNRLEVYIGDIRDGFNYQYAGGKHWYDYLHKQFPFYYVIQPGHITTGKPVPSTVKLLIPHLELLEYRLNKDFDCIYEIQREYTDLVPVDTKNLRNYVVDAYTRLNTKSEKYSKTLSRNIANAAEILDVAKLHGGNLPHTYCKKRFNRYYASGINLQNTVSTEVRQAALGKCYKYDISSASYAFRLGYMKHHTTYPTPALFDLVEHKHHIRKQLAEQCLTQTDATLEHKIKLIKSALNMIGFGANTGAFGSLKDIIWHIEDRKRFLEHKFILELKQELDAYSKFVELIEGKHNLKQFLQLEPGERYSKNSAESKMYQTYETQAMEHIFHNIRGEVLLWVHDCVYTKKRQGVSNLNFYLHELPYWKYAQFEEEKIDVWHNPLHDLEIVEHLKRIDQEEADAHNYASSFAETGGETEWDKRQAEKLAWEELYAVR